MDGRRVIQRTAAGVKGCDVKSSSLLLLGQPENRGDGSLDQTADLTENMYHTEDHLKTGDTFDLIKKNIWEVNV